MARTAEQSLPETAAPVCLIIHAVFADVAYDALPSARGARIVTTDTIPLPSNAIRISGVLAKALRSLATGLDLPIAGTTGLGPNPAERTSE
ncbi:MAG: hypothetical protein C0524_08435 [Rhodobacter sp.]|nr:hypothetical protein [Rhodobacter sp.]